MENAAGDQLEDEFPLANDHSMPGVMPPLIAGDDVELLAEQVDDLAFALVAPLCT